MTLEGRRELVVERRGWGMVIVKIPGAHDLVLTFEEARELARLLAAVAIR